MSENQNGDKTLAQRAMENHDGNFAGDGILSSDFIMGKEAGVYRGDFSHVSGIWLQQCMTFDAAKNQLAEDQRVIRDIRGPLSEWRCDATNEGVVFTHVPQGRSYKATQHAMGMLPQVGLGLSKWVLQTMQEPILKRGKDDVAEGGKRTIADFECLRDYINLHVFNAARVDQSKERLFRTWEDGTLRAFLSSQYTIVNNQWFLDLLSSIIPGGMVSHWKGDADVVYGNILIPDTIRAEEDSDLGGMLSIGNSEIGTRRISSLPSVFRAICMNGCIWDQTLGEGINKVHRGSIDFAALADLIRENLLKQIPLLPQGIERFKALRNYGCGTTPMTNIMAQVAADNSMSKKQVKAVADGWGTEMELLGPTEAKTAYGLVNGITRAGQTLDNDKWVDFDVIGGAFASMEEGEWDKFLNRAGNLSPKQVVKRLGEELVAA